MACHQYQFRVFCQFVYMTTISVRNSSKTMFLTCFCDCGIILRVSCISESVSTLTIKRNSCGSYYEHGLTILFQACKISHVKHIFR